MTTEIAYAISNLSSERADAVRLLEFYRGHLVIENRPHYVSDMAFGEDDCGAKIKNFPQDLAAIWNMNLTLLRHSGISEIHPALRRFTSRPFELLPF